MDASRVLNNLDTLEININSLSESHKCFLDKLNSEFAVDGKIIGTGMADYTQQTQEYVVRINNKEFSFIDMPGIEGNEQKFSEMIQKAINRAHLVMYIYSSGKHPETATVNKIKNYLRNDSDVYAICNVHLPPKKKRDPDDGTYEDELQRSYNIVNDNEVKQTKAELKKQLSDNFKDALFLNGLLAFSSLAYDQTFECTTIYNESEGIKLQRQQRKYAENNDNDYKRMQEISKISTLTEVINNHVKNFDVFIMNSNKKKLLNRLNIMYQGVIKLQESCLITTKQIKENYRKFKRDIISANRTFERDVSDIPRMAVKKMVTRFHNEFNDLIDDNAGDLDEDDIRGFFEDNNSKMKSMIKREMKKHFDEAQDRKKEGYKNAQNSFKQNMITDMKFQISFEMEISQLQIEEIADLLHYSLSKFCKDVFDVAKDALMGAIAGGPLLALLAAATNLVSRLLKGFLNYIFGNEDDAIQEAKGMGNEMFNDIESKLIQEIEKNMEKTMGKQNDDAITVIVENQTKKLDYVNNSLKRLSKNLEKKMNELGGIDYGTF
ncbi:MAG: GTPase domain-containing protein [Acidaminococcaceae bacterium]|nr:GTPase domain-containing protein [Acidaminococcaceae bacterium]